MFGITENDILEIDEKLTFQLKYYDKLGFEFGEDKTAKDFIYSANLNPKKYFAEINKRVNTIMLNTKERGLYPCFFTLTAPSKYHQIDKDGNLIINPNETAKILTEVFNKFTKHQIFKDMKKELGHGLEYFRVYEPHKSGVPHCHIIDRKSVV